MPESHSRRRRTHNAEESRIAILSAAEAAFAAHGFAGARVDSTAAEAGYNKSLIFQYFGDKLNLYAHVLKRVDEEARTLRARMFAPFLTNGGLATDAPA